MVLGRGILRGVPVLKLCYNDGWAAYLHPTRRPLRRRIKAHICPHRNVL